ncbi:MAG: 4Fe-4S binding protein [Treponema sp.]|nr:4Fe-4S binding protein [Treponema sp.]
MILLIVLIVVIVLIASVFIILNTSKFFVKKEDRNDSKDDLLVSSNEIDFISPSIPQVEITDKRAMVMCNCHKEFKGNRSLFNKEHTCFMINSDNGTGTDCKFSCIGLGDCARVCPQQAINIVNNTAVITNLCIGCGKCIDACPLHIIQLISKNKEIVVKCYNQECEPTSCSAILKEEKVEWPEKKDFKIWRFCYRIVKGIIKS